jgi:KAP family P-loop domain
VPPRTHRILVPEGPVDKAQAFVGRGGVMGPLARYSDEIVNTLIGSERHGFVLGLLGEWGCGKSSAMLILLDLIKERLDKELEGLTVQSVPTAQEPLARMVRVTGTGTGPFYPVTSSLLRAPLSLGERSTEDARLDLAQAILLGLPPGMQDSIAKALGFTPPTGEDTPRRRMETAQLLREVLHKQQATGTEVEQWIRYARSDYLEGRHGETDEVPSYLHRNVHVTMLEDLDRAQLSYTAQILNAVRFWVDTEGMFFVVSAPGDYLRDAALLAIPVAGEVGEAEERAANAIQKFVHHELHMPLLLESADDVSGYWQKLLESGSDGLGEIGNGVRELLQEALRTNSLLGVLAPLLSPRMVDLSGPATPLPREAKHWYNALVGELSQINGQVAIHLLKRNVAALAWREAWADFVQPALNERTRGGPRGRALDTGLGLADLALRDDVDGDLATMVERLRRLAGEALFDISRVPPTMLLYLAADPRLDFDWSKTGGAGFDPVNLAGGRENIPVSTTPRPSQPRTLSPEDGPASAALPTAGFHFVDPHLSDEASDIAQRLSRAAAAGEVEETRSLTAQFNAVLQRLGSPADASSSAPAIGNAALRMERADIALSWQLHQLAHLLNPEHANVRLNLAEFLLDYARGDDAWNEVEAQLDWLAANAPEERPERQIALRARLSLARGDREMSREIVEELLARAGTPDASFDEVRYACSVLSNLKFRDRMETFIRDRLRLRLPDDVMGSNTYTLLRVAGDELTEETGELEARGADIFRYMAAVAFCPNDQALADVLNNLAIICNTRRDTDYTELARQLWLHAIRLAPDDHVIRRAYGRYMEGRDEDSARRLQLGQPLEIPDPVPGAVRSIVAGLPAHMSEGPWWWEEFAPSEPGRGLSELAVWPLAGSPGPAGLAGRDGPAGLAGPAGTLGPETQAPPDAG